MIPAGTKPASQTTGSATGTYSFEICFKKDDLEDSGNFVCANQFDMTICKYTPTTWTTSIHHNVFKDLTIDLGSFLDDDVGENFVDKCFDPLSTSSDLVYKYVTSPAGY